MPYKPSLFPTIEDYICCLGKDADLQKDLAKAADVLQYFYDWLRKYESEDITLQESVKIILIDLPDSISAWHKWSKRIEDREREQSGIGRYESREGAENL